MDLFLILLAAMTSPTETLPLAAAFYRHLVPGPLKGANPKPEPPVPRGQGT